MTYEEAKTCKQHLELLKVEIEWDKSIGYQIDLDLAIDALEKQIPKKPKVKSDRDKESTFWYCCPICNEPLNIKCGCQNNECLQAIDWSEKE